MTRAGRETLATVAPYALWMALMLALPATGPAYAARTAVSAAALAVFAVAFLRRRPFPARPARWLAAGLLTGIAALVLWIAPESSAWYRRWCVLGSGATASIAADAAWVKAVRLIGSAFVIAPAEELFFRSFLYRWLQSRAWTSVSPSRFDCGAFLWTVALFALEHDRFAAGAVAGALYGFAALRWGLGAAVVAHVTTNLLLGLYVLAAGAWAFW